MPLAPVQRAVLLAVLYADLFDFAPTEDELYARLVGTPLSRERYREVLAELEDTYLSVVDGFVVWKHRIHLVALRRSRQRIGAPRWEAAHRYARWLRRVPFVRMVAVSGSLAADNAAEKSDVDVFCITAPQRLWIARLALVPLARLTRAFPQRFPVYLCPNYLLAADALAVDEHNLFTAHEIVQAVPLWGDAHHARFLEANPWVTGFLPHAAPPTPRGEAPPLPRLTRWCERLLSGRAGDVADACLHRLFVAGYRLRARRAGWHWAALAPAYQRSRYTVPEGGYARVVPALFAEHVRRYLGDRIPPAELDRLFPDAGEPPRCYDWEEQFRHDYGRRPLRGD